MAQVYPRPVSPPGAETRPPFIWWVDVILVLVVASIAYGVVALAARSAQPLTPKVEIDLSPLALPGYAAYSTLRMAIAYVVAAVFSIAYARLAAASPSTERVLIPLLDILQSIPILSFMPGVVLALVALFPGENLGLELAAIVLIFTSQAWNLAFGFHQSLATIPRELRETATVYRLGFWDRFTRLELPFGMIPFIWNSMMSWAGGWFFLIAAEQFSLGDKNFQLPGLGSYLKTAADAGDVGALFLGLGALIVVVILLDVLIWRPLVAWSERFKVEQSSAAEEVHSPVLTALRRSALLDWIVTCLVAPAARWADQELRRGLGNRGPRTEKLGPGSSRGTSWAWLRYVGLALVAVVLVWGGVGAARLLVRVSLTGWVEIGVGAAATLARTTAALVIAVLWTVPVGVSIGLSPRWAPRVQPLVQIVASIPATGLFPVLLLILLGLPGGLNLAAVALMLLGTQWYVLFNVIAGTMAIPTDLREAATVYKLSGWRRWRYLILPAIFPSLVTGMITATGGAWNASVVSEYVTFGNQKLTTVGLGSLIASAADAANFPLLLAGTLVMAAVVVLINRVLWRQLYTLAQNRYRLE